MLNNKWRQLPELYDEAEAEALEEHIKHYFGDFATVFHELESPDIHVDIAIINPSAERNYYTLVTMGMGAHRMNVPLELNEHRLKRAELLICLPPDWKLPDEDEAWYWPLRWLKVMARLPGDYDTWLGWGHTVPKGAPFAANTKLGGMMLIQSGQFDEDAWSCEMPDGSKVVFYAMIPLYQEEMDFKIAHNAQSLLERMSDDMLRVLDIQRENVCVNQYGL